MWKFHIDALQMSPMDLDFSAQELLYANFSVFHSSDIRSTFPFPVRVEAEKVASHLNQAEYLLFPSWPSFLIAPVLTLTL